MDSEPPENRTPAALQLANFLDRLSRWNVLNLAPGSGSDGPYWQREIVTARSALDALVEDLETARRKVEAYDRARAHVKIDGATRAEYVLRAKAAEARALKAEGERDAMAKGYRAAAEVASAYLARAVKAEGERDEARREKGEAEEWLGTYGAGGTPAGLVGGIHNLAHRAEKAEGDTARLRVALERIDALREVGPTWVTTYGDLATACEIARAALVVADEAPSEPPVVAGFQSEAGLGPIRKDGLAGGSLGAVEAPGRVTDGGPPQTTPGDSRSASVVSTAAKLRQRIHACANFCDLRLSAGEAAELDRLIIDAEESYGRLLAEAQSFEVAVVALPQGEPGDREADEALVREALAIGLEFDGRDGVSADESWDYFAKADAALVRLVAGVQAGRPPGTPNEAGAGDAAGAASSDTPRQGEPQ